MNKSAIDLKLQRDVHNGLNVRFNIFVWKNMT